MSKETDKFFDITLNSRDIDTDEHLKSIVRINADIIIHQEKIQDMFSMEDNPYIAMSKLKDALYDAVLQIQKIEF